MPNLYQSLSAFRKRILVDAVAELRSPRSLVIAAVLASVSLVLNQFTIPVSQLLEISFDFLAVAAIGYLCGPWLGAMAGFITDLLGYFLRPNGPYFPGFTLSAILAGIVYGLWYYKKPVRLPRVIGCKLTVVLLFNFLLTPLWLHLMYGKAFVVLSSLRLVKNIIKFPLDVLLLYLVLRSCERYKQTRR